MKFNLKTFAFLLIALCAFGFSAFADPRHAPGGDNSQMQSQPVNSAVTIPAAADSVQLQPTAPDQPCLIYDDNQLKEFAELVPFDFDNLRFRPVDNIPLVLPDYPLTSAGKHPARYEPDVIRKPQ